jgi:dTDP-4-dehydrorhamnose reductase
MKVLVTGSAGQLGSKVVELLRGDPAFEVAPFPRASLDITREDSVREAVRSIRPSWVINCAAFTDVERAESEPEAARQLNDVAVGHLADAALEAGARLMHFSTDYVFSGDFRGGSPRPYVEEDPPEPINSYGATKWAGESRLERHPVLSTVLRTSWLYGGPGKSFLHTILRRGKEALSRGEPLRVVNDQRGSPTDVWSLASQVRRLLGEGVTGLFHASSAGEVSWFEFALEILRRADIGVGLEPISSAEYRSRARRPPYSSLASRRLEAAGLLVLPPWKEGLDRAWRELVVR